MIAYTFLVVLTLVVAYFEARQDASDIKKHLRIDHAAQLWERARLLGVLVFCTIVGSCWENGAVKWEWRALFFLPICWAVFTVSFRRILNWFRALHSCYISDSNVYDRFWLDLAGQHWSLSVIKTSRIYKAGKHAYLFELSILALSTWAYLVAQ